MCRFAAKKRTAPNRASSAANKEKKNSYPSDSAAQMLRARELLSCRAIAESLSREFCLRIELLPALRGHLPQRGRLRTPSVAARQLPQRGSLRTPSVAARQLPQRGSLNSLRQQGFYSKRFGICRTDEIKKLLRISRKPLSFGSAAQMLRARELLPCRAIAESLSRGFCLRMGLLPALRGHLPQRGRLRTPSVAARQFPQRGSLRTPSVANATAPSEREPKNSLSR